MKKLITLSIACILVSILFSSCKSNMSITRRHYTSGYYIAYSKGKNHSPALINEKNAAQPKAKQTVYSVNVLQEQNNTRGYYAQNYLINNNVIVTSNKKIQDKAFLQVQPMEILNQTTITKNIVMQTKHNFPETKVVDGGTVRDGLSLFWIVILVILILWAVGFFVGGFGLGALINLLLLVALILLILWLLRIL